MESVFRRLLGCLGASAALLSIWEDWGSEIFKVSTRLCCSNGSG